MKKIIFILILLILVSGCSKESLDEKTSKCISSKSVIYISNGCVACAKQEQLFGENFKELNVIDCVFESKKCREAGITKVPTWFINEKKYEGVQTIEKLKELTGC